MINKKTISPVIAVSLLLLVSILSIVVLQGWFGIFQGEFFVQVEKDSSVAKKSTNIEAVVGDNLYFRNAYNNILIKEVRVNEVSCPIQDNFNLGIQLINISSCLDLISQEIGQIVVITDKGLFLKTLSIKDDNSESVVGSNSSSNFITLWDVSIDAGLTGINNIELPLQSDGNYDFTVDWGDGNISYVDSWNSVNKTHNYATGGEYVVNITGTIEGFAFNAGNPDDDNLDDGDKLIDVMQWGNLKISDGGFQFSNCDNLLGFSAVDTLNTTGITNMSGMFAYAVNFNQPLNFDTSNVIDMSGMFAYATNFNQPLNFDTSNVINMGEMFVFATNFNQSLTFDTRSATNMEGMFAYASNFNQPLNFDTGSVTNMEGMFFNALSFNQPLNFDTSNVINMGEMFGFAENFNQPLNFDTSNVTDMYAMFGRATNFNQDISDWCVSLIGLKPSYFDINAGFEGNAAIQPQWGTCPVVSSPVSSFITLWDVSIDTGLTGLNSLELPLQSDGNYDFTVDWGDGNTSYVNSWDSSNKTHTYTTGGEYVVNITGTIEGFAFNAGYYDDDDLDDGDKLIDVLQWGSLKISDGGEQFSDCENLFGFSATDILNTTGITNMSSMFAGATSFNQPLIFDTSSVTNMSGMFAGAISFDQPLTFDTSNVIDMSGMFAGASSFNQPLSFDTSSVINMDSMFFFATSFNQSLTFDTSSVINMYGMFSYATNFNQPLIFDTSSVIDMSQMFGSASSFNQPLNFNTSNVTLMEGMFVGATSFNQPLSFDTSSVTNMGGMFFLALNFNQSLIFDTSNVTDMSGMFQAASNFNRPLSFDTSSVTNMAGMFYGASSFNQDISNWCVSLIGSKPINFDVDSGFAGNSAIQPQWNTCP